MLQDLDLNIVFKINKNGALSFLLKTGDLRKRNSEIGEDSSLYYLGKTYMSKDAQSLIGKTTRKFTSEDMLMDANKFENTFKADLQSELDLLYEKDTFEIIDIKVANIQVSPAIEEKIQAVSILGAELEKTTAIERNLESRKKTLALEAATVKYAADHGCLTIDQFLQYELIKAIKDGSTKSSIQIKAGN